MDVFFQSVGGALVLLVVGFVFLVKGADFFVEGASSVAKRLKVPSLIIGLTIVAMGTSLPETAVSISASIQGNNTLAISNVTGSNIFNLMVVVGICAIMTPVAVQAETIKRDIPFSLIAAVLLLGFGLSGWELDRVEGLVFLVLFAGFIYLMVRSALKARAEGREVENESIEAAETAKLMSVSKSIICIVGGAIAIAIGGDWVVDGASTVAKAFGFTETLIGLTIVAVGTSLPELVTSVVAARKNEVDMALGNAIGSNVFNILMVLGIASVISPVAFIQNNCLDIIVLIVCTLVVWIVAWRKKELKRPMGIFMLVIYVVYMVYIVLRDM